MDKKLNDKLMQEQHVLHQFLYPFCVLMLATLLTGGLQSTVVDAVDINYFTDPNSCSGPGTPHPNVSANICPASSSYIGSIQMTGLASNKQFGAYYRAGFPGGGCSNQVSCGFGPGTWCFTGGDYTGAYWIQLVDDADFTSMITCGKQAGSDTRMNHGHHMTL
jgi:hypothetical protein